MKHFSTSRPPVFRPSLPPPAAPRRCERPKNHLFPLLTLLLVGLLPLLLQAQTPQRWEVGGGVGVSSYQGDLDKFLVNFAQRQVNPAFSLHLRRYAGNLFALRGSVMGGRLSGDERNFPEPAWRRERGLSFHTMLWEAKAGAEFYPLGQYVEHFIDDEQQPSPAYDGIRNFRVRANGDTLISQARRRKLAPYLFLGLGAAYANPQVNWNESGDGGNAAIPTEALLRDRDAQYSRMNAVLPVGAGIRIPLSQKALLGIEAAFHYTFSDYLDGVSHAGNSNRNDWYFIGQVSFSWPIGQCDRDGDGLADQNDRCPTLPGPASANGCPDADLDGLADQRDRCPHAAGLASLGGCPDSDQDGVADVDDLCPKLPGKGTANGCPVNSMPDLKTPYKVVYFDPAADKWLPSSQSTLEEAVAFLEKNPNYSARIEGNADHTADASTNKALSETRAQRCRDYLTSKGLDGSRLSFTSFGDKRPLATSDVAEGRRLNNRVEIYFFQR
jgi:outer membrane protein OmpA-like peptidoglycan-associated protein